MPQLIGMDEAGYGPNLGPLVITATSWTMADDPRECDLFDLLSDVVTRTTGDVDRRLHVGDSKQVYSPAKGLRSLELTVLAILRAAEVPTDSFHSLWHAVAVERTSAADVEPWHADGDFPLPVACDAAILDRLSRRLMDCLNRCDVEPPRVACEVVLTERFNSLTIASGSKGQMLSRLSISLLRHLWNPDGHSGAFIICDKHGGRNRYDELLAEVVDGQMIFCTAEGRELSAYRIGKPKCDFKHKRRLISRSPSPRWCQNMSANWRCWHSISSGIGICPTSNRRRAIPPMRNGSRPTIAEKQERIEHPR